MIEQPPFHLRIRQALDRPIVAILTPALLSLLISMFLFCRGPMPQPNVQDEFSYLLAADTYAHGRLTNAPPALWPFFEAPYMLVQPTYMAKYLPGQGLILAFGQLLGQPIFSAFLMASLSCAAIAWLIGGVLPYRWGLLGGCLAAGHPTLVWWSQIYWGGGVPLLGGALMTGAVVRWIKRDDVGPLPAWLTGIGASLLVLTRPFAGGIVGLLLAAALGWTMRQRITRLIPSLLIAVVPLIVALAFLAYSNHRVTGSAWTLPYAESEKQYMSDQYMAPVIGGFIAIAVFGYRRIARWRFGFMLISLLLAGQTVLAGVNVYRLLHPSPDALGSVRLKLIEELRRIDPAPKLVFVRHLPLPNTSYSDVVYNSADIDSQEIIFARDLGDESNRLLLKQYANRKAYRLTFETIDLQPYSLRTPPTP